MRVTQSEYSTTTLFDAPLPHTQAHSTLNLITEYTAWLLLNRHLYFAKQIWSYISVAVKDDQA